MKEKDDREIIEEAKKDSSLFGLIYLKHFKKIYQYVWFRVGKSAKVAEDLVQETFLLAFTHLGKFKRTSASYLSYLFRIAKNLLVSHYRKKQPLPLSEAEDISVEVIPALEKKLDDRAMLASLKTLPEGYQKVLRMKYIEDLPIRQIAKELGKTENAVKLILHRAKHSLKNEIESDSGRGRFA